LLLVCCIRFVPLPMCVQLLVFVYLDWLDAAIQVGVKFKSLTSLKLVTLMK
jgi:hypothetical protein